MILADTSIWIDHFRKGDAELARLLEEGQIAIHPFVIGELACGALPGRNDVLWMLAQLPRVAQAEHDEVMGLLDQRQLAGKGLGWVDMHLLAAALVEGHQLWTRDARLRAAAESFVRAPFARA